jgi:hypothetical protein
MLPRDFVYIAVLEQGAIASIEAQNCVDGPLMPQEKILIAMAVAWTYGTLKEMAKAEEPALP